MKVFFEEQWWNINFPDDIKYFKLTRKYYPCLKILIQDGREIEIKYLKHYGEVRSGKFNLHHLCPKSRGGSSIESNLLRMDISRHNALHLLFGNLTLLEIIKLLQRLYEIKERQRFSKFL